MINLSFNALKGIAFRMAVPCALALSLSMASCESIYDDTSDCRTGIALQFVYDYHMEPGANAFPANVDCVDVYVFDTDGNYTGMKYSETSDVLRNESYRMEIPLDPGSYHLVVYGGLACENPTFNIVEPDNIDGSRAGHKDNIVVSLPLDEDNTSHTMLHDIEKRMGGLFYGTLNVTLTEDDLSTRYREEKVEMMKNTNNIQVILQEINSPYTADYNEFGFRIEDDNFTLDGYNNKIASGSRANTDESPYYQPYAYANRTTGYIDPGTREGTQVEQDSAIAVQVACAEFSTSRLLMDNYSTAQLVITSKVHKDGNGNDKEIIRIPLVEYLSLVRGFGYSWIKSDQEFLDRQSNWTLMFFLNENRWVSATIAVNNWVVRLNNITL